MTHYDPIQFQYANLSEHYILTKPMRSGALKVSSMPALDEDYRVQRKDTGSMIDFKMALADDPGLSDPHSAATK